MVSVLLTESSKRVKSETASGSEKDQGSQVQSEKSEEHKEQQGNLTAREQGNTIWELLGILPESIITKS